MDNEGQARSWRNPDGAARAAWICMAIAWAAFLLPLAEVGFLLGWTLNLVAFILAIVSLARQGVKFGLLPLLATLIASPCVYSDGVYLWQVNREVIANIERTRAAEGSSADHVTPPPSTAGEPSPAQ